jgi:hypothetical protein
MTFEQAYIQIAEKWHRWNKGSGTPQLRKYTGEPYDTHTKAVAELYKFFFPEDVVGIAAAHGHDLLEDTGISVDGIRTEVYAMGLVFNMGTQEFRDSKLIIATIIELTDIYTKEKIPKFNRSRRKALEADRLGSVSERAQNIKALDLVDNTHSIVEHDRGFAKTYLSEKAFVLSKLTKADYRILSLAHLTLGNAFAKLTP